jgi:predicted phage terminase large subunit-like protein
VILDIANGRDKAAILAEVAAMTSEERQAILAASVPRMVEPYVPHVPHPAQSVFLLHMEREVFYGGAGGGGKSDALLMAAAQFVDVPGYSALILRRSFPDLTQSGAIMDRAEEWWTSTPARKPGGVNGRTWYFPTVGAPARVTFGYVQRDADVEQYRGAEYQCVAVGTLVQMANGAALPIEMIRAGDYVRTLQGPARVTHSQSTGVKPVVEVTTSFGKSIISATHPILTAAGIWASPQELQSTEFLHADTPIAVSLPIWRAGHTQREFRSLDLRQAVESGRVVPRRASALALSGTLSALETADATSYALSRADSQPPVWYARLGLLPPALSISPAHGTAAVFPRRVRDRARGDRLSVLGSQDRYCFDSDLCDERFRSVSADDQVDTPSRGDVGGLFPQHLLWDDHVRILRCNPAGRFEYRHPYSSRLVAAREVVHPGQVSITPSGVAATWDVTVEGSNHFVLASSGIVSRNCILWDELTQFHEKPYRFLFSRLRGPALMCLNCNYSVTDAIELDYRGRTKPRRWRHDEGFEFTGRECSGAIPDRSQLLAAPDGTTLSDVPIRMRGASNPGGIGHAWVRDRLVNPSTAIPDSVFVPAKLGDNPSMNRAQYRSGLAEMTSTDRARIEEGDWDAADEGTLFQREWFKAMPDAPDPSRFQICRFWDLAATAPRPGIDPDWTCGVLVGLDRRRGEWWILDAVHERTTPAGVQSLVVQTALADRIYCGYHMIRMEQEPGSSGVNTIAAYRTALIGYDFDSQRPTGSKGERARPLAVAAENGSVKMLSGDWNRWLLDELSGFPGAAHDDAVDASSGAFNSLSNERRVAIIS